MRRSYPLLFLLAGFLAACAGSDLPTAAEKVEDDKARAEYYEQAAKTYYDGGKYEASARMWGRVLEYRPNDQWAKFGVAKAYQMNGTPENLRVAQGILTEILPLDWTHPTRGDVRFEVQSTLAAVYSDRADLYDRDIRILEDKRANDESADETALNEQIRTQTKIRNDLLRQSIPIFRQVLQQSPDNPYALAGLAKANLVAGNEEAGIRFAERYIDVSQKSQVGWKKKLDEWQQMVRGDVTPEQRNFYVAKIQGARQKELQMSLLLGSVHMRREEFAKAVQRYNHVLDLDPAMPAAYVERAQAKAAVGLYGEAVEDLERYLKLTDPEKQRQARVRAADLMERYQRIAATQGGRTGGRATGFPPAATPGRLPPAGLPPVSVPGSTASGSPDG